MLAAVDPNPVLTWNLVDDVRHLFDFPFMVNALRAGTIVAIAAGLVGWYMVLRRETFAGHTLALVGFPGGAAAVLVGVSAQLGFFTFCVAGALAIALVPQVGTSTVRENPAVVGTVQVTALAAGYLFVSLHGSNLNGINALLFGGILGVTTGDVARVLVISAATLALLAVVARPLLFASIDAEVAAARGVPVRGLRVLFLVMLGLAAAASAQITGALLVFTLLVVPAATAQSVTSRPAPSAALAVILAVAITWLGLGAAYYSPYPSGFWITTIAFVAFLVARVSTSGSRRPQRRAT